MWDRNLSFRDGWRWICNPCGISGEFGEEEEEDDDDDNEEEEYCDFHELGFVGP